MTWNSQIQLYGTFFLKISKLCSKEAAIIVPTAHIGKIKPRNTDTDQKSCSYCIIEPDIYFKTQQLGLFSLIIKLLNKNLNISKLMVIVGKPEMLPRSVWVYFNAKVKQTQSLLHTFLVFMQSESRHAT